MATQTLCVHGSWFWVSYSSKVWDSTLHAFVVPSNIEQVSGVYWPQGFFPGPLFSNSAQAKSWLDLIGSYSLNLMIQSVFWQSRKTLVIDSIQLLRKQQETKQQPTCYETTTLVLQEKLDVDPQRDDDASPISTYARWDLLECSFKLFSINQNTSQIQFRTFLKKIKFLGSHVVVLVKTFPSVDVSITYVGLILTKLRWFQLFVKSQNSYFELSQNSNFELFFLSNFWVSMM